MDRLLSMILNLVLRRGMRAMLAGEKRSRRERQRGDPGAEAQDAAARDTEKRMRESQRLMRRMGR